MEYTLHVAKTYKVQYSEIGFNWMSEEVNSFLCEMHLDLFRCYPDHNGDIANYAENLEFDRENWRQMIAKLREHPERFALNKDFTNGKMADEMQRIMDLSDPDNNYIVLHWF